MHVFKNSSSKGPCWSYSAQQRPCGKHEGSSWSHELHSWSSIDCVWYCFHGFHHPWSSLKLPPSHSTVFMWPGARERHVSHAIWQFSLQSVHKLHGIFPILPLTSCALQYRKCRLWHNPHSRGLERQESSYADRRHRFTCTQSRSDWDRESSCRLISCSVAILPTKSILTDCHSVWRYMAYFHSSQSMTCTFQDPYWWSLASWHTCPHPHYRPILVARWRKKIASYLFEPISAPIQHSINCYWEETSRTRVTCWFLEEITLMLSE